MPYNQNVGSQPDHPVTPLVEAPPPTKNSLAHPETCQPIHLHSPLHLCAAPLPVPPPPSPLWLQWLDLSANALSGPLPPSMSALLPLKLLYLQDNQMTGQLPPAWQVSE